MVLFIVNSSNIILGLLKQKEFPQKYLLNVVL